MYFQNIDVGAGINYVNINKKHNGYCVAGGYSSTTSDVSISDCSITADNSKIKCIVSNAMTVSIFIIEFYH